MYGFIFDSKFTINHVTVYLTQKFLSQFTVEVGQIRVVSFSWFNDEMLVRNFTVTINHKYFT